MKKYNFFKRERTENYSYVISKEQPLSYATESFQKVVINLEYSNLDKKYKIIQFTSTLMSEGKTTAVFNIAHLLQQRNNKVLLIDLDLRRPKIHQIINVANENGINDYLIGNITKEKLINKSEKYGIDYILTGTKTESISNILNSNKIKELIKSLREDYDYILIDTPPVLAISDALIISSYVDGVVYMVSQGFAVKKDVKEGFAAISRTNKNIIGTILTQAKVKGLKYYEYYE